MITRTTHERIRAIALALTLAPAAAMARAADGPPSGGIPDVATIRANIAKAAGPIPPAFREVDVTTTSTGVTTIEHDWRRGDDYRAAFDTGPFHTERGVVGGRRWHMNDNGQVVRETDEPNLAARETMLETVAPIASPVAGYVIATLNARGFGTREYVDGARWVVVRAEQLSPNGTIVTTYSDIRPDQGRTFAHVIHTENGYAGIASDERLESYDPGDVPESDVGMPPARRRLVGVPAGVTSAELPARFIGPHIDVRVDVGGRGLDFILDTGASGITIDSAVAAELGLREYNRHSAFTAGRYDTARTIVPEMRVGPLVMRDVRVQTIPQAWQAARGVREVGLLGFDFLAELGVTIDYERQRVTVAPGDAFAPPAGAHVLALDVRLGNGQPLASASLNGALGERWAIDTGGAGTFMVFDYFARRNPSALRDQDARASSSLLGIGGPIPVREYAVRSFVLGNVDFRGWNAYRVTGVNAYDGALDGAIGPDFLKQFTVVLDYPRSRVYLAPNAAGRRALGVP